MTDGTQPAIDDIASSRVLAVDIADIIAETPAADTRVIDIHELSTIADVFVICSGENERQLRAITRTLASCERDDIRDIFIRNCKELQRIDESITLRERNRPCRCSLRAEVRFPRARLVGVREDAHSFPRLMRSRWSILRNLPIGTVLRQGVNSGLA